MIFTVLLLESDVPPTMVQESVKIVWPLITPLSRPARGLAVSDVVTVVPLSPTREQLVAPTLENSNFVELPRGMMEVVVSTIPWAVHTPFDRDMPEGQTQALLTHMVPLATVHAGVQIPEGGVHDPL